MGQAAIFEDLSLELVSLEKASMPLVGLLGSVLVVDQ